MLISPPFLPARANPQADEAWLATAMSGGDQIGQGFFPVGPYDAWHGGLHLRAPAGASGDLPVCAIADGTVAYRRAPQAASKTHALNYHGSDTDLMWTDNGVVVLRHTLELGDGDLSAVVVYSIYMHLSRLHADLPAVGAAITRKTRLGTAGSVAGTAGTIHFEMIVAPDQIERLCGRSQRRVDTAAAGRTTVLGTVYARLPAGTEWRSQVAFAAAAPAGVAAEATVYTSTEVLYLGLHYENAACVMTLYNESGETVGANFTDAQGHYTLHDKSAARFPASPLAGYELMRYGRTIGSQALAPAGAAHWREAPRPGGTGWVNLNAADVRWYSDADFPHWRGWHLVADDADTDVRMNSAIVEELRRVNVPAPVAPSLTVAPAGGVSKLTRLACLFPTEWSDDDAAIEERYGWVKTLPMVSGAPQDNYDKFAAYIKAQGFWMAAALAGIPVRHWHLNPRALIGLLRGQQLWPVLADRWQTACTGHVLPDQAGLSNGAKASLFEYAVRSSKAAAKNHTGAANTAGLTALDAGNAVIFGMRVPTDINANLGLGVWDDGIIAMKKDNTGLPLVIFNGTFTTEPSGRYLDGGAHEVVDKATGENAGGTNHLDIGRLIGDRSYEYLPVANPATGRFGPLRFGGAAYNILQKTAASQVERLIANTTPVNETTGTWQTGAGAAFSEGATMHFHKGYDGMTGSAGCQTFPHTGASSFDSLMQTLEPLTDASRFHYVLKTL